MCNWVKNRSLVKGLKYRVYTCSKPITEVEKILDYNITRENMCDIVFEKTKGCGGTVDRTRVFMQKQPSGGFFKKCVMRNFAEFTIKHLLRNLFFDKVKLCRPETSLKVSLKHRCFLESFAKFVRTPCFAEPGDCF